ncbi:MAG: hypothetical protein GY945_00255 [Rhodobacteraceae bacterium]|nr:hypothetical protein [Paracoccaceae bacterium]
MSITKVFAFLGVAFTLAACQTGGDRDMTRDSFSDTGDLSNLIAGIWIDPNGCQHWIIDDGVEGYLSARMDPYGKPICNDIYPTGYAIGDYKAGQGIADFL